MADPKQSAVTGDQNSSVPTGTPGEGGVTQVTPSPVASDANLSTEQLLAKLKQADEDRKRVQSLKDREVAEERKRAQELAQKLEEIQKQGMTDAERVTFERDQYKQQLEQMQAELRFRQEVDEYSNYLSQLGVDVNKLDRSNPEAMANSAWTALVEEINALRQGKATTPPAAPTTPVAPTNNSKVITGSGGVPHTKPTFQELMKAVGARNSDELYAWAERHPDQYNQWLRED